MYVGQVRPHTVLLDGGHDTDIHTEPFVFVVEFGIDIGALLQDSSVELSVESVLGMVGSVDDLPVILETGAVGEHVESHLIKQDAVHFQPLHSHQSVESVHMG